VELHEEYLNIARKKARDLQLTNIEFIHGRAEEVILEGEFDCIASDYLAKYVDLDLLVSHARKMLRKGGVLIMHELTRPTNLLFVGLWKMHFKFLQTCGKLKYPEWGVAFRDLPLLLTKTQWVHELTHALRANEFVDIKVEYLFLDHQLLFQQENNYSRNANCYPHLLFGLNAVLTVSRRNVRTYPERWGNRPASLWIAEDFGCCASG
jgi:ubiquinone/menaquinone biosynthesis C-methylase UbiE